MSSPLISIIVPVYNAENTLYRCVDSILQQTFTDWELLLIDDGSKDSSGDICDEYARKDSRIKVFHKENGGVSSARNIGLDNARGEWITFVDSDDWIVGDFLQTNNISYHEDLILYSYYVDEKSVHSIFSLEHNNDVSLENIKFKLWLSKNFHKGIFRTVWSKLFRTSILHGLRFDNNIRLGEDNLFLIEYLKKISSCRFVDTPFYIYTGANKYQLGVCDAVYIMSRLFSEYQKLNIKSGIFERDTFCAYKSFCQGAIYMDPASWYLDKSVRHIYKLIKSNLSWEYRFRYFCLFLISIWKKYSNNYTSR